MKKILLILLAVFMVATVIQAKKPSISARKAKAKMIVNKAIQYYLKYGHEKALETFTDKKGGFIEGEYYISVIDFNGVVLIHGVKPALNGKNLWKVRDPKGVYLVQEIVKQAKSKKGWGWASYSWPHPETKLLTPKTTYVKKIPGKKILIHVGIYLDK
jgi:signal transduction histidine kinase